MVLHNFSQKTIYDFQIMSKEFAHKLHGIIYFKIQSKFTKEHVQKLRQELLKADNNIFQGDQKFALNIGEEHNLFKILDMFKKKTIDSLNCHENHFADDLTISN